MHFICTKVPLCIKMDVAESIYFVVKKLSLARCTQCNPRPAHDVYHLGFLSVHVPDVFPLAADISRKAHTFACDKQSAALLVPLTFRQCNTPRQKHSPLLPQRSD